MSKKEAVETWNRIQYAKLVQASYNAKKKKGGI
jgi:hypothetical protein